MTQSGPTGDPEADLTGKTLGDFKLLRRLGQGGMGQVYLARQESLKREVAVKLLRSELSSNPSALQRFKAEAEAVARLTHANIVQVYSIGEAASLHYMALEYVEGKNLREYLTRKGPPDLPVALSVIRQVASALQRAGEMGFIHRDIKPENILLTRKTEVKVADFGLSRCFQGEESLSLTQSGVTMGTPLYMSPEQVQGRPLDPRSDIYSFGVTCYHMLTGDPPFRGNTPFEVALKHVQGRPRPLSDARPDLPEHLCAIVEKMMAKEPAERYQTAREILKDLARLRDGGAPLASLSRSEDTKEALPALTGRPRRRWARWVFVATVALAAGLVGAASHRLFGPEEGPPLPDYSDGPAGSGTEAPPPVREPFRPRLAPLYEPDRADRTPSARLLEIVEAIRRGDPGRARRLIDALPEPSRAAGQVLLRSLALGLLEAHADRPEESMGHFRDSITDRDGRMNERLLMNLLVSDPVFAAEFARALRRNEQNLRSADRPFDEPFEQFLIPPAGRR